MYKRLEQEVSKYELLMHIDKLNTEIKLIQDEFAVIGRAINEIESEHKEMVDELQQLERENLKLSIGWSMLRMKRRDMRH